MKFSNGYDWQFYFQQLDKCQNMIEIWAILFMVCEECGYDLETEKIKEQAAYLSDNGWPLLGDFIVSGFTKIKEM